MGAVGYKYNYGESGGSLAKKAVVSRIEEHLEHEIMPTVKEYKKFNVFRIILRRGIL